MSPAAEALAGPDFPRRDFVSTLAGAAAEASPRAVIVTAPRGWGKAGLISAASDRMRGSGRVFARLDTGRCATHPDEFACSYAAAFLEPALALPGTGAGHPDRPAGIATPQARLRSCIASPGMRSLPRTWPVVEKMAAELGTRRGRGGGLVTLALQVPPSVGEDIGRPLPLLADDLHEMLRLVPFPGLGDITERFARHLAEPAGPVLVASVSPHGRPRILLEALGAALGDRLTLLDLPALDAAAFAVMAGGESGPDWSAERIAALTGGRLLTGRILARRLARGGALRGALLDELADPGGSLALEMRFDYNILIERTRGHAASRAILNILAREDGLDLTGIARRLRRSAGSTLDYLKWLLEVNLLARRGRRYGFADPLLRLYVLLHEVPERPESFETRSVCIDRFLAALDSAPVALSPLGRPRRRAGAIRPTAAPEPDRGKAAEEPEPRHVREEPEPSPPRKDDFLMEID